MASSDQAADDGSSVRDGAERVSQPDGAAAAADGAPAGSGAPPAAPGGPRLRGIFRRWMAYALLGSLAAAAIGALLWLRYHERYEREPPTLSVCFKLHERRLKRPQIVAASEPLTLPDGQTVYLTNVQHQMVGCVARIPGRYDVEVARVFGIEDPDERATAMADLVVGIPPGPEHDYAALAMWRVANGTFGQVPESPARKAASQRVDDATGCRFHHPRLPGCPTRPPFPVLVYVLLGAGGAGVLTILGALVVHLVAYVRARRAARARPSLQPG